MEKKRSGQPVLETKGEGGEEGRGREASLERDLEKRLTINDGIYD